MPGSWGMHPPPRSCARGARVRVCTWCGSTSGGTGAATDHHGDARVQGLLDLLRANEMNVAVDPAGGEDFAFPGNRLGTGTDDNVHPWLHVRIAGFADAGNAAIAKSHIGLDDAGVVDDQSVGDDGVDGAVRSRGLPLPHAIADHLAATEFYLLAVNGEVLHHLH